MGCIVQCTSKELHTRILLRAGCITLFASAFLKFLIIFMLHSRKVSNAFVYCKENASSIHQSNSSHAQQVSMTNWKEKIRSNVHAGVYPLSIYTNVMFCYRPPAHKKNIYSSMMRLYSNICVYVICIYGRRKAHITSFHASIIQHKQMDETCDDLHRNVFQCEQIGLPSLPPPSPPPVVINLKSIVLIAFWLWMCLFSINFAASARILKGCLMVANSNAQVIWKYNSRLEGAFSFRCVWNCILFPF